MKRPISLCVFTLSVLTSTASADLVISQYYYNGGNNKWIEVFNAGPSAVNLSNYSVGLWSNTNAEGYKTGVAPNASDVLPSVSLSSGGVFLLSHTEPDFPPGIVAGFQSSSVLNFNGNDSFAIYSAGAYGTSSLVDAIGFTNNGNQGANKGFVRLTLDQGYSLVAGSNVLNFATVWKDIAVWEANIATVGMDAHLGSTSLVADVAVAAIPEPTAALFGWLVAGIMGLTVARRPAKSKCGTTKTVG